MTPSMALSRRVLPSIAFGQLVSSEAARPAAGQHEAGDASGGHGAVTGRSCGPWARDVAVRGPAQDPAPVEILEDGHDVLATRPGRVAKRRRGERRGRGEPEGGRGDLVVRGRRVGEVAVEHDDAACPFELADPLRRAAGGSGCLAERRRGGDGERPFEPGHRVEQRRVRAGDAARPSWESQAGAVTDQVPIGDESVDEARGGRDCRAPPDRREASQLPGCRLPHIGQGGGAVARGGDRRQDRGIDTRGDVGCDAGRAGFAVGGFEDPVQVETSVRDRRAVTGRHGRGQTTDTLRGLTPPRDPARRRDIDHQRPDDPVGARRSAQDQPIARRDRERRSEPDDRGGCPVGKIEGVATTPADACVDGRGPEVGARPRAVGQCCAPA